MSDIVTLRTATPVARRAHRCSVCGSARLIQPGDRYERQTCVYDGRVYDWITCTGCQEVTGDVIAWAPYWTDTEGLTQEAYIEWAAEHAEEDERAHRLLMRATEPVRDDARTDWRDLGATRLDLWRQTRRQDG